ncbi:glycogen/starch synthase [Sulfurimonas sp. HSL-1716]|uniref:glycogen synthase n=1 Tax=Hydrocurvibacter sulfurireducens TaxID=3131937 RepID=UPI0031F85F9E
MKVLFASSEIFPYAKSGGLADVADALPHILQEYVEISRVMPLYGFMDKDGFDYEKSYKISLGGIDYKINLYTKQSGSMRTYFIEAPLLSATKNLYCDKDGDYANNDLRFGIFCMALVELASMLNIAILHLNDWHTALCALFIHERKMKIKTVFTIHNLAYQGIFGKNSLERLGIDKKYFTMDGLEFYEKVNFLKAAIAYSDRITTVSPSYAKEILTKEFGCGLEGFLAHHKKKLTGVLNGINDTVFDPAKDAILPFTYDEKTLDNKYKNKADFIKRSKLKDPRRPLFVMIARLVEQKGIDLLIDSIKMLLEKKINLFLLGEGSAEFSKKLARFSNEHDNFEFFEGYDEELSHRIYAAADFLLMPSKFEPCGLNQMIAMRYGTIPIVHAVGGLKDSVHEDKKACGEGIVFKKQNKKEFLSAVERALKLKKEAKKFKATIEFNMGCDFSFRPSALEYLRLYKSLA